MTSKVIASHKSSSNFSVNPTLPLLDGHSPSCSLFPSFSLTLSLYIPLYLPLLLYAKNNLHTAKCFLICFLVRPLIKLYFAVWEISQGIKGKIFSFSLSSPFHSLSIYISLSLFLYPSPFHLSLPLSIPFTSLSFSYLPLSLSFYLSFSLFSVSFSLAYLMDVFVIVHNIKYDLKGNMRPLFSCLILKILDLLIKLQP